MQVARLSSVSILIAVMLVAVALPACADDACKGFKWDVSKERALYSARAVLRAAGKDATSAAVVTPNRLYRLRLNAQDEVALGESGTQKLSMGRAYAGMATLEIDAPGRYRVSVDTPLWIDVLAHGKLVPVTDFAGSHDCNAPRKIVEFELAARESFLVQVSGSDRISIRLTVTPSPVRKL